MGSDSSGSVQPFPTHKVWEIANDMRELESGGWLTKAERLARYRKKRRDIEELLSDYEQGRCDVGTGSDRDGT